MSEVHTTFAGYVFQPGMEDEATYGTIDCDRWRLRFGSERLKLEFPLDRLQIELLPGKVKRVRLSDPQQPEWLVYTDNMQVLREPHLLCQSNTRSQIRALHNRAELQRALVLTAWFVVGFGLVMLSGWLLVGMMVRSLVAKVPPELEQQLGQDCIKELKRRLTFVEDPKLKAQLDHAVAPLLPALPKSAPPIKFFIVEFPLPNACALPGGYVIVTTDLLALVDRPEEIAGVVAHELAHITQKHGLRRIISSAGPYLVFKMFAGNGSGLLSVLGQGSQLLVSQSFSQEYELEADSVGWDYLVAARIDPRGMTDMLRKLAGVEESLELRPTIQAFSTHPATEKRIQRLEAKWEKLENNSGFINYDQPPGTP
jgi:Zn-dependent protease with chaperone function